jgi:hypothetical protein
VQYQVCIATTSVEAHSVPDFWAVLQLLGVHSHHMQGGTCGAIFVVVLRIFDVSNRCLFI